jgi:hypothetical protein
MSRRPFIALFPDNRYIAEPRKVPQTQSVLFHEINVSYSITTDACMPFNPVRSRTPFTSLHIHRMKEANANGRSQLVLYFLPQLFTPCSVLDKTDVSFEFYVTYGLLWMYTNKYQIHSINFSEIPPPIWIYIRILLVLSNRPISRRMRLFYILYLAEVISMNNWDTIKGGEMRSKHNGWYVWTSI